MKNIYFTALFTVLFFASGCDMTTNENASGDQTSNSGSSINPLSDKDKQEIKDLMKAIEPPVRLNSVIKNMNVKFSPAILSSDDFVEDYSNGHDQALAIGIYASDLVYCHMFHRNDLTRNYLVAINRLTEKLNLHEVIAFKRLYDRIDAYSDSNDLTNEFAAQMNKMYNYLEKTDQMNLSAMMSFGSWIESVYIASEVGKEMGTYSKEMTALIYHESTLSRNFLQIFQKFHHLRGYENTFEELEKFTKIHDSITAQLEIAKKRDVANGDSALQSELPEQLPEFNEKKLAEFMDRIQLIRNYVVK